MKTSTMHALVHNRTNKELFLASILYETIIFVLDMVIIGMVLMGCAGMLK